MPTKTTTTRIYLDNGATSWPKPQSVIDAITDYYRHYGAAASRGGSNAVGHANRIVEQCRNRIANLIHASDSSQIVFAFNGTDALNMAILGLLSAGQHVVATAIEHNSVLRPLSYLETQLGIRKTVVPCDPNGWVEPDDVIQSIQCETQLVCLSHVSNVTGAIQAVEKVGQECQKRGVPLLIDAAQSVGHLPIDVTQIGCDLLAASGHKGLMGPLGTGFLYIGDRVREKIRPLRLGGTGSQSDEDIQPTQMPWRMESGNLNIGGIAGMLSGLKYIEENSIESLHDHAMQLTQHLREALNGIQNVKTYSPTCSADGYPDGKSGSCVTSFNILDRDCREVGSILDSVFGIELRTGFHCAPRIHAAIGSDTNHGTLRVTPGCFNTVDEIDQLTDAVRQIATADSR